MPGGAGRRGFLRDMPVRWLILSLTGLAVALPVLCGGLLLESTSRDLVLDTYAASLADSVAAAKDIDGHTPGQIGQEAERRLSWLTNHYQFTLYITQGLEALYSRDYQLAPQTNSFPLSWEALGQVQREASRTLLFQDLYRGQLLYVCTKLQNGMTLVCIFPTAQFRVTVERFWMVILLAMLFAGAMLFGANLLLKRLVTDPLEQLVYEIRNPDLPTRTEGYLDWKNEIGRLCDAYRSRAQEFSDSLAKINQLNDQKRESELDVLQNQINSHFIYNTLNNIQWLASDGRTEDVIATVRALDCLLRACSHNEDELVTIEEELGYVDAYLTAQKIRFGDVFDYSFEIDVLLIQMKIPKFILQPIVENSIYHGFINCNRQNGQIKISVSRRGHRIDIRVADNGIGIEKERIRAVLSNRYKSSGRYMGVALGNVNRRIKLLCGREYGLGIRSEYGRYTLVEVTIPISL